MSTICELMVVVFPMTWRSPRTSTNFSLKVQVLFWLLKKNGTPLCWVAMLTPLTVSVQFRVSSLQWALKLGASTLKFPGPFTLKLPCVVSTLVSLRCVGPSTSSDDMKCAGPATAKLPCSCRVAIWTPMLGSVLVEWI